MSHVLSVQIQSNATCQKLLRAFFNWCLQICWPCICSGVLNKSYQTIITHLEAAQNCCSPTSGLCDTNYIFCKIKNREDHRHEKIGLICCDLIQRSYDITLETRVLHLRVSNGPLSPY